MSELADPAEDTAIEQVPTGPHRARSRAGRIVVALAALAVAAFGFTLWTRGPGDNPAIARSEAVTSEQLEAQYGVRIDVIGLIASGGLVELRFQVVDAENAAALFGDSASVPELAVEGSSRVLRSAQGMKHSFTLLDGASYFFLYANADNALHEGSQVSVVVNDVRLPHLVVLK